MKRTQIYLTDTEYKSLHSLVYETGKSQSELIRLAIDQFIASKRTCLQDKLKALRAVKGMWQNRTDLPDFAALRGEFDRKKEE
jgi:metal-responsive CopG/Arc/MetJ family transcriptional regulator